MRSLDKRIAKLKASRGPVSFYEVKAVCDSLFGSPRIHGSHVIYKMPWADDPRVNIQNRNGFVPPYQLKQVLMAIERLEQSDE